MTYWIILFIRKFLNARHDATNIIHCYLTPFLTFLVNNFLTIFNRFLHLQKFSGNFNDAIVTVVRFSEFGNFGKFIAISQYFSNSGNFYRCQNILVIVLILMTIVAIMRFIQQWWRYSISIFWYFWRLSLCRYFLSNFKNCRFLSTSIIGSFLAKVAVLALLAILAIVWQFSQFAIKLMILSYWQFELGYLYNLFRLPSFNAYNFSKNYAYFLWRLNVHLDSERINSGCRSSFVTFPLTQLSV